MDHQETLQLIAHCRAGETISVEKLVHTHQDAVYRLARSILNDRAEAEEATQDTFIAALGALDSYRGEAAFTTWLYTITLNVCRGRLRKRQTRERLKHLLQTVFRLQSDTLPHPEDLVIRTEADAKIWQVIQSLGEKHRLPLILRYYHDFSTQEIAEMLGINEATVRTRLYTARERMRLALQERK